MQRKISRLYLADSVHPMNNTNTKSLDEIWQQLTSSIPMNNPVNWDGDNYPMPTDMLGYGGGDYGMEGTTEDGIPEVLLPNNLALDLLMDSLAEDLMSWTAECDQCEETASDESNQDTNDPNHMFPGTQYPNEQNGPTINQIPSYMTSPMSM